MTLTPERRAYNLNKQYEAAIDRLEDDLTALRLKRKHAHDNGNTITVDVFDVEIAEKERFIERQRQRAAGVAV